MTLVLPVLLGVQAIVHYLDDRGDLTSLPGSCASSSLSQNEVARHISDPPEPDTYAESSSVHCTW
jgi:hypothetical protein